MNRKTFTLEEARGLVDWLENIFRSVDPIRNRLTELGEQIRKIQTGIASNGGGASNEQFEMYQRDFDETAHRIEELIKPINDKGILVKSIQQGLVDFPSIREGREVYLCWQLGEQSVMFWHEVDIGFMGRKPL